jgi:hypothetical protein
MPRLLRIPLRFILAHTSGSDTVLNCKPLSSEICIEGFCEDDRRRAGADDAMAQSHRVQDKSNPLQTQFAQPGMIVRAPPRRPVDFPLVFLDRQVIDAGKAMLHQPIFIERPVFVAAGTEPVACVVAPFIGEADGDALVFKSPWLLDQTVVDFWATDAF